MLGITYDSAIKHGLIRFPNAEWQREGPHPLFYLPDGENILVNNNYSGSTRRIHCERIGLHHMRANGEIYHIDQFAELMAKRQEAYYPEKPVADFSLFCPKYLDRSLKDPEGNLVPYRMLWANNATLFGAGTWKDREMSPKEMRAVLINPMAVHDRQGCIMDGDHSLSYMDLSALLRRIDQGLETGEFQMRAFEFSQLAFSIGHCRALSQELRVPLAEQIADASGRVSMGPEQPERRPELGL